MAQLSNSLVKHIQERASKQGQADAFLQKRHGVWARHSWQALHRNVEAMAAGLLVQGLRVGESVAILSSARIEAVTAVYACQRAGLRPVLLNPSIGPGAVATFIEDSGCVAMIAEDQEQIDKVADIHSRLSGLRLVWVIDPKGVMTYKHISAPALATVACSGASASIPPEVVCDAVALYTSGVHTEPRLVSIPHATLMLMAQARGQLELSAGERCVSLFGLSDSLGHFLCIVAPVLFGVVPCFGEDRLPSVAEMRECTPAVLASPARLLDRLRRETLARSNRAGSLRRGLIGQWLATDTPGWAMRELVGRPLANTLGLGACRMVACGYDRMSTMTARFISRMGIQCVGLYGLTEAGGPVGLFEQASEPALSLFAPYEPRLGVRQLLSLQFAEQEVSTGDVFTLEGGRLHLIGREADLITLPDGQRIAPGVIEAELMASPYVNQAVAVGGPTGGVTALVELDEVTLRDWARAHGLSFTTSRSFSESTEVSQLVAQALLEANQRLLPAARVVGSVMLPRPLDASNGELTPALALRRSNIRNRYSHRLTGAIA